MKTRVHSRLQIDAVRPDVDAALEAAIAAEEENRAVLADAAENWAVVENYLREKRAQ